MSNKSCSFVITNSKADNNNRIKEERLAELNRLFDIVLPKYYTRPTDEYNLEDYNESDWW